MKLRWRRYSTREAIPIDSADAVDYVTRDQDHDSCGDTTAEQLAGLVGRLLEELVARQVLDKPALDRIFADERVVVEEDTPAAAAAAPDAAAESDAAAEPKALLR